MGRGGEDCARHGGGKPAEVGWGGEGRGGTPAEVGRGEEGRGGEGRTALDRGEEHQQRWGGEGVGDDNDMR